MFSLSTCPCPKAGCREPSRSPDFPVTTRGESPPVPGEGRGRSRRTARDGRDRNAARGPRLWHAVHCRGQAGQRSLRAPGRRVSHVYRRVLPDLRREDGPRPRHQRGGCCRQPSGGCGEREIRREVSVGSGSTAAAHPGGRGDSDLKMVRGRAINEEDVAGSLRVAVVNERFVEKFLSGLDPLRQRILVEELIPGVTKLGPPQEWQI